MYSSAFGLFKAHRRNHPSHLFWVIYDVSTIEVSGLFQGLSFMEEILQGLAENLNKSHNFIMTIEMLSSSILRSLKGDLHTASMKCVRRVTMQILTLGLNPVLHDCDELNFPLAHVSSSTVLQVLVVIRANSSLTVACGNCIAGFEQGLWTIILEDGWTPKVSK